jgi:hypothetical protein
MALGEWFLGSHPRRQRRVEALPGASKYAVTVFRHAQ